MVDTEYVVVGGGIVGCTAAMHLAEMGQQVTVIDKGFLFGSASTENAGGLHFQLSFTAMREGEQGFKRHLAIQGLNIDAHHRWKSLDSYFDQGLELEMNGGLVVGEDLHDEKQLIRKVDLEQSAGFETQFVGQESAHNLCPDLSSTVRSAAWHPWEGHVNPRHVSDRMAQWLEVAGGVTVSCNTSVLGFDPTHDGRWRIFTDRGEICARKVILAAGAWTGRLAALAGVRIPMQIRPLTMSVSRKLPTRRLHHLVMHASYPLSVKQVEDGNMIIGGGRPAILRESQIEWPGSPQPDVKNIFRNLEDSARVLPFMRSVPILRSWHGVLGYPDDGLPVLGQSAAAPGLIFAVGGHTGWTIGPSCGYVAASLACTAHSNVEIADLHPDRFREAGSHE